jgi:putative ABC transport system permease protein
VIGVDPTTDPAFRDRPLAAGEPLGTGDQDGALVSARLAREDDLAVGSPITRLGHPEAEPAELRVVGIMAGRPGEPASGDRAVVVSLAAAGRLFATDRVSAVDVLVEPGADRAAVIAALESRLDVEPYTIATPADTAAALEAATTETRAAIALVAAVALFGGAFLIFNTLAMTVAERARDVGLLRAAGMTRRQVTLLVLFAALHLGVAGVALGVVAGVVLAVGAVTLSGEAAGLAGGGVAIPWEALVLGSALGLVVTAAAAVEPALRAGGISPVAALRER